MKFVEVQDKEKYPLHPIRITLMYLFTLFVFLSFVFFVITFYVIFNPGGETTFTPYIVVPQPKLDETLLFILAGFEALIASFIFWIITTKIAFFAIDLFGICNNNDRKMKFFKRTKKTCLFLLYRPNYNAGTEFHKYFNSNDPHDYWNPLRHSNPFKMSYWR